LPPPPAPAFNTGSKVTGIGSCFFCFQPTYNTARTPSLSTAYEFTCTLGWQIRRFSLQVRPISNGGSHYPNRGEAMALGCVSF